MKMIVNDSVVSLAFPSLSSSSGDTSDPLVGDSSTSSSGVASFVAVSLSSMVSLTTAPTDSALVGSYFDDSMSNNHMNNANGFFGDMNSNPSLSSSSGVVCEAPLDITDYNFSDYDFPRAQGTFKPFTHVEYIKIIVTIIVILVALAGNLGIIIAVSFNRSLRTTINLYLVNLAVADILICTCCMSVYLINQLTEPLFILGPIVCKLNAFCQSEYRLRLLNNTYTIK